MSVEMRSVPLGEFVTLKRGTTYKSAMLGQPGPVLLGLGSIERNGGFRSGNLKTFGGDSDPRILLKPGDIYVSLKDVTQSADLLGAVARVPSQVREGRLTQDTVKLVWRTGDAPADYIYWLLRTPQYRAYCRAHATGTTNLGLPRDDFLAFPIPALNSARHTLVELLEALEGKIENNRRMNEMLEAMARELFRDWFIYFGPTRAMMEGREPYLDSGLWSLFPDRFDSERKPDGWIQSAIGDEARVVVGGTPSTRESGFWGGSLNWATPKDLSLLSTPVLLATARKLTEEGVSKISSGMLPQGTVLLSSRAPIGYVAIAEVPVAVSKGFIALECDQSLGNMFIWLWVVESMKAILAKANGSTFQEVSKKNFRPLPILRPPQKLHDAFDQIVRPLYERMVMAEREARSLVQVRDALLPRLMSGELRIRDAERMAEAVT